MQSERRMPVRTFVLGLILLVVVSGYSMAADQFPPSSLKPERSERRTREAPAVAFTANRGQWPDSILFRANRGGETMWFMRSGIYLQFMYRVSADPETDWFGRSGRIGTWAAGRQGMRDSVRVELLKMEFVGSSTGGSIVGDGELEYRCNYFRGNDPQRWRRNVPSYSRVVYRDLYPGVDLVYSGSGGQVECRISGDHQADGAQVRVRFSGARSVSVDEAGRLEGRTSFGDVSGKLPAGVRYEPIDALTFDVRTNPTRALPKADAASVVLSYGTYLGGSGVDYAFALAVDDLGNAYVAGYTDSDDFPTRNPYQSDQGNFDAYVVKLSATGDGLVYGTYLGGSDGEEATALVVDGSREVYVSGWTYSTDFPTWDPYQTTQGGVDAFVIKLNAAGDSLRYGTYLGGSNSDAARALAIDDSGNAYVAGSTYSFNFPTQNSYQTDQGADDAFVAKLSAAGNSLVYGTYLGGSASDEAFGIAVDGSRNACVTGYTRSGDFPTQNPFQTYQGLEDGFVVRLNAAGDNLEYGTYLGGSDHEYANAIALDDSGNVYVAGLTNSGDFPTHNPYQSLQVPPDAFVVKLSATGDSLVYGTYLGGNSSDQAYGIAVDRWRNACVAGITASSDFPTRNPFQAVQGGADVFVTILNAAGASIGYSTYLGGSHFDIAYAIAVDSSGNSYVAGYTHSTDFPTQVPYQPTADSTDAFAVKLVADFDLDGIPDYLDNCMMSFNPLQEDTNGNGIGDVCDVGDTLVFSLYCPVDMVVTDPHGDSLGIDSASGDIFNTIQRGSSYDSLTDQNSAALTGPDGERDDIVTVPNPLAGSYSVRIIRESDSQDSARFTLTIRIDGNQQLVPEGYRDATVSSLGTTLPASVEYCPSLVEPGNCDGHGAVTSADIIFLVNYTFKGGSPPQPVGLADINCSGNATSADVIALVNYVFKGGLKPCSVSFCAP